MKRPKTFRIAVRKYGPFESAIRKQWDAFERAVSTGLELEAEALDLHPLFDTLFTREGLKRGAWDVAFLVTDWVAAACDSKAVLNLAPLIAADPPDHYPAGWTPSLLRLHQIGGQVLGLPYHDGPECLIYRKDLFEDAGEPVPATWDEFRRVARHLTRPKDGLYGTVFAAFPDGHNTVYDFCLQLWTRGGELFDGNGNLRLNTPAAIDALEFYRGMLNDPAVHPGAREFDSVKSGLAFAAGEIAMMVNWFGFATMAETVHDSRVRGRIDVATVPHAPGCSGVSLNVYWILAIGAGSPHRDVAYRFLRHCATARMDKLLTLEGAIGCRKSTWTDPDVNRIIPFYQRMVELHESARELPRMPGWPQIARVIDELVLAVINTGQPVAELAAQAQDRLNVMR